jgi:twinkle protein
VRRRNDVQPSAPDAFTDKLVNLFYGTEAVQGALLPWVKTHDLIRLRPGEVSLICGYNGHGKSQASTQMALDMAFNGEKVVIGSFEMNPERTLYRMVRQAARSSTPSISFIKAFIAWCHGRIWLLNRRGMVEHQWVSAAARYAAKELGATQFIVDNLAKCVRGEDDFNGQKLFTDNLCSIALDTGMHMHLIHHLRKGETELELPDKMSIKGSGAITDAVDNVFIVWRNKRKERMLEAKAVDPKLMAQSDCVLRLCKQRNGTGREADIGLWYAPASMSYAENSHDQPRYYDIAKEVGLI